MTNTAATLRDEVARAFAPLTSAHGFARQELYCDGTHETYVSTDFRVRASRDRDIYVDVAGSSDPDSWFNVARVIRALTEQDPCAESPLEFEDAVGLMLANIDVLREGLDDDHLAATQQKLKRPRGW